LTRFVPDGDLTAKLVFNKIHKELKEMPVRSREREEALKGTGSLLLFLWAEGLRFFGQESAHVTQTTTTWL